MLQREQKVSLAAAQGGRGQLQGGHRGQTMEGFVEHRKTWVCLSKMRRRDEHDLT